MTALARVPAHDLDAEAAVLSAVILDPEAATALSALPVEALYSPANRLIWQACQALAEVGTPIDAVTVANWLKSRERLAEVGGVPYLAKITDSAPSVANIGAYVAIVASAAKQRAIVSVCQRLAAEGYGDVGDVDAWAQQAEAMLYEIASSGSSKRAALAPMRTIVREAFAALARGEAPGGSRIFSGIPALDEALSVSAGDLVVLAARPGMGKSALAAGWAAHVALPPVDGFDARVDNGHGASLIFSVEMDRAQVAQRLVCAQARFPLPAFRRGDVHGPSWGELQQAAQVVQDLACWVDDTPAPTIAHLRGSIQSVKRQLGTEPQWGGVVPLRLVVVDYLQLLKPAQRKGQNREQEVAELTRQAKELAREERVAIVLLSQLNRGVEQRANKRPTIADLRESGAIEQDADSIVFVYRDEYYDKTSRAKGRAELLVEKQRNGPQGRAIAAFDGAFTLFRELTDSERRQLESEREDEPARDAPARRSKW